MSRTNCSCQIRNLYSSEQLAGVRAGEVTVEAFANFSQALWAGGASQGKPGAQFGLRTVDYSTQLLSTNEDARGQVRFTPLRVALKFQGIIGSRV